jgi:hypothetical protein
LRVRIPELLVGMQVESQYGQVRSLGRQIRAATTPAMSQFVGFGRSDFYRP